ncbi:flagellar FliJ family protein [Arthrobacter sp. ATA002]|uniref:flagellar FliJ family protein n=1 Tax=Arthrobacter sp. ATA002 TaxID=2991715 RepID=UPI0022A672E8|nr:flagellar FliJ family protein [Arthrobacter sp. ATA002]WAP51668.1 flagellar FliJ family protein [Arthrobacter sp. ATA002]
MNRTFPLAGLLRLRRLQEEAAAGKLAAANARVRETSAEHAGVYQALTESPLAATDSATLHAVSAARASSRAMLADLAALGSRHAAEAAAAQAAFSAARAESVGLEKLEARHAGVVAAEDLRAEQTVLDELAGTAWQRRQKEAMP